MWTQHYIISATDKWNQHVAHMIILLLLNQIKKTNCTEQFQIIKDFRVILEINYLIQENSSGINPSEKENCRNHNKVRNYTPWLHYRAKLGNKKRS